MKKLTLVLLLLAIACSLTVVACTPNEVEATLTAVFDGKHVVYDDDSLESLNPYLSVTYTDEKGQQSVVTDYTVSGTLAEGDSVLTVKYNGLSCSVTVKVEKKSTLPEPDSETYTVTFIADGKTVDTRTYTAQNTQITEPAVPTKVGYTGIWREYNLTVGDVSVFAEYTPKQYTVSFDYNGATSNDTQQQLTVTFDNYVGKLPAPQKTGYIFEGWFLDGNKVNQFTVWNNDGNFELIAKWTAKPYYITFIAEGKKVGERTYTVENNAVNAPAVPAKTGYNGEWETYTLTVGDVTVNAVYTAKQYAVTLNYNGADENDSLRSITVTYDNAVGELPAPVKTGHVFAGWYLGDNQITASNVWKLDGTDFEFDAKWTANKHTVTFNSNGGSEVSPITDAEYASTVTEPEPPLKDGNEFFGWFKDVELKDRWYFDSDVITGDTTLYAKWNPYTQGLEYRLKPDGNSYMVTGKGTATDIDIVIPSVYDGKPVTEINNNAFRDNRVNSVVIPNSIKNIKEGAFVNCSLTKITLGTGLEYVQDAFYGYNDIAEIHFTGTLAQWCGIDFYATVFVNNHNSGETGLYINGELVTEVNITGVTEMGRNMFFGYSKLTSVVIGKGVKIVGYGAFRDCKNLTSILIENDIEKINKYAFWYCPAVTDFKFNGTSQEWANVDKDDCFYKFSKDYIYIIAENKYCTVYYA